MSFNIQTATNAELKAECERLKAEYTQFQTTATDAFQKMYELSDQYIKIKELLDKREGRINATEG